MEKLVIPSNLKIEQLIELNSTNKIKGFKKEKVFFICDSIYVGMSKLNEEYIHPNKNEKYFVPLNAKVIQSILGNKYHLIIDWMIQSGIILSDNHYIPNVTSIGYRLTDKYLFSCSKTQNVDDYTFSRKSIKYEVKSNKDKAIVKKLEHYLKDDNLAINHDVINHEYNYLINSGNEKRERVNTSISYSYSIAAVNRFEEGSFSVKQCDFGYRVHSPLTCLKKEYRNAITYEGKDIIEIDLCNSMFFFMNYLINPNNWNVNDGGSCEKKEILKRIISDCDLANCLDNTTTRTSSISIMISKYLENAFGKDFHDNDFTRDTVKGEIYDRISSYISKNYNYILDRGVIKKVLIKLTNASKYDYSLFHYKENKIVWNSFKSLYPNVVRLIDFIKSNNHKDFARILQRIESYFIIKEICGSWIKQYPNKFITTVHDCVATTFDNVVLLENHIKERIRAIMGIEPSLETKIWRSNTISPECLEAA